MTASSPSNLEQRIFLDSERQQAAYLPRSKALKLINFQDQEATLKTSRSHNASISYKDAATYSQHANSAASSSVGLTNFQIHMARILKKRKER